MNAVQRVLLREIEVILRLFKTADPSSGESLRDHLDHLNTMLQFLTIIVVAGEKIRKCDIRKI